MKNGQIPFPRLAGQHMAPCRGPASEKRKAALFRNEKVRLLVETVRIELMTSTLPV